VSATAAGTAGNVLISGGASADPSYGALNLAGGSNYISGTLPVGNGGIGVANPTAHGILLGEGSSAATSQTSSAAGQVLLGNGTGSDPSFSATPTLGVNGTTTGQLLLATSTGSGASITVQNGGATTAYNFNLPTTAGTAGYVLTSQGGGTNAMTWTSLSAAGAFSNNGNAFGAAALLGTTDSNTLSFETSGSTWMTILTNGNVGIGTTSPGYPLDVNGNVRATAFISTSDRRAKENIETLDSQDSLRKISSIRPVSFTWKSDGTQDMGVIAQELRSVYPEIVMQNPDGTLAVKYNSLIAPLLSSVQTLDQKNQLLESQGLELQRKNQLLEAKDKDLELKNKDLESRIKALEEKIGSLLDRK
jgi:hypothetical protein